MKLSVVIVSYNVKNLLKQAIDSLLIATDPIDCEFFVVDNASEDGTVAMLEKLYPHIHVIANAKNVGFSVANNQAIKVAKGQFVLVINPDTVTQPDTLVKAIAFLDAHPETASLGVRMVDGKGRFLPESKRGLPTPWVSFCKLSGLYLLFPKSKVVNRYYMGWINEFKTQEVEVLTGAFMLLRKTALETAGLFDERFFMYGEDVDLSYRLTLAGYKNYYYPEVYITHYKGQSTHKLSLGYLKSFYGSMFIFAKKYFLKF